MEPFFTACRPEFCLLSSAQGAGRNGSGIANQSFPGLPHPLASKFRRPLSWEGDILPTITSQDISLLLVGMVLTASLGVLFKRSTIVLVVLSRFLSSMGARSLLPLTKVRCYVYNKPNLKHTVSLSQIQKTNKHSFIVLALWCFIARDPV